MRRRSNIWRGGGPLYKFCLGFLILLMVCGVFANFLANNKPLLAKENEKITSPVTKELLVTWGLINWNEDEAIRDWKSVNYDFAIWPIIPYKPSDQDPGNLSQPPFSGDDHFLGTDYIGRDVLSAMIYSIRYDMSIGVFAMLIAGVIGILLGGLGGFHGDNSLRVNRLQLILLILFLYPAVFYGFMVWQQSLVASLESGFLAFASQMLLCLLIFLSTLIFSFWIGKKMAVTKWTRKAIAIPLDSGISRIIEVVVSIPVIYLLIMLVGAMGGHSLLWVILAIGLTRWTGIARFTRAEMLRIKSLDYISAANSIGLSKWRQFWNHAMRNALPPVLIALAFGVANAILLESFLAFIGLGLPPDIPTWGSLLNEARQDASAWWLAVFPGLAIFSVVLIFNYLGDHWSDKLAGSERIKKSSGIDTEN